MARKLNCSSILSLHFIRLFIYIKKPKNLRFVRKYLGRLKKKGEEKTRNNKNLMKAITALLPEYKQPLNLPRRCYSLTVQVLNFRVR